MLQESGTHNIELKRELDLYNNRLNTYSENKFNADYNKMFRIPKMSKVYMMCVEKNNQLLRNLSYSEQFYIS